MYSLRLRPSVKPNLFPSLYFRIIYTNEVKIYERKIKTDLYMMGNLIMKLLILCSEFCFPGN